MNWQELSATSHYKTALAIAHELELGHSSEADKGIKELINALSRSEKRALKSQLVRLMKHILKWKNQSDYRSRSWVATIQNARVEIKDIQEEPPPSCVTMPFRKCGMKVYLWQSLKPKMKCGKRLVLLIYLGKRFLNNLIC